MKDPCFRVYDNAQQKMIYLPYADIRQQRADGHTVGSYKLVFGNDFPDDDLDSRPPDTQLADALMQYTGIHDIYGVAVYEGDFVARLGYMNAHGEVFWGEYDIYCDGQVIGQGRGFYVRWEGYLNERLQEGDTEAVTRDLIVFGNRYEGILLEHYPDDGCGSHRKQDLRDWRDFTRKAQDQKEV